MIWTARAILLFSVLHLLFLSPSTNAAVGAIAGRITDRQSGAVIEGATITVVVAGQVLSATSQFDGSFGLGSLELGHYDLSVQAGGYKPITLRDLVVESDKVTIREIALDSAPPSDKRPDSIETNEKKKASDDPQQHMAADSAVPVETRHYIDRDEMHHLPVRYPDEAVALQNGVATLIKSRIHFKQTHIRGGRLDNNSYLLNGVRITEATNGIFSATVSPYAVGSISFMPGNYSAEYGQANGGIISISMPSGGPRYSGTIESVSDNVGGSGFDQNWYTGTLSGPVPGLSNSTFFTSVERRYLGDERPSLVSKESLPGSPNRLPNNWRKGFSFAGRLDFQIRPKLQLSVTGNRSTDQWRQYIHSYLFNSEHMPYHSVENMVICAELSHEISSRTSYRLAASFAENERFRGDGLLREDLLAYNQPGGNPRFNTRTLFWDEGHVWDDYLHQKTSSKGLKGILTLTPGTHHQIKLGFDLMRHTVRSYQHFFPAKIGDPTDATDYDNYLDIDRFGYDSLGNESDGERMNGFLANRPKHPVDLAAFVQERFTWRALRVSLGIRLDRYDYDTRVVRSSARPLDPDTGQITKAFILNSSDLTDAESYTHLSPRLGLAISMGE
ncbi:MAG: carboxypeptidase regulatory-like domain-containing protein, partial [Candidatus Zixiibacteriota bacterium]